MLTVESITIALIAPMTHQEGAPGVNPLTNAFMTAVKKLLVVETSNKRLAETPVPIFPRIVASA
jgi:hypothetical protein